MSRSRPHPRQDRAHHHPSVRRDGRGWWWTCPCGGTSPDAATWHRAVVSALVHATAIAA